MRTKMTIRNGIHFYDKADVERLILGTDRIYFGHRVRSMCNFKVRYEVNYFD